MRETLGTINFSVIRLLFQIVDRQLDKTELPVAGANTLGHLPRHCWLWITWFYQPFNRPRQPGKVLSYNPMLLNETTKTTKPNF
jgi:hypothetical protein